MAAERPELPKNDAGSLDRRRQLGDMPEYPHADITRSIIGSAFTVHRRFGYGFLELVYKRAMVAELRHLGVVAVREVMYKLEHRNESVGVYLADLVVAERVIAEVKTGLVPDPIGPQLTLNYLKASGLEVGLFINFGPKLTFQRVVYTKAQELPQFTKF
jgi:GxxExxY protein